MKGAHVGGGVVGFEGVSIVEGLRHTVIEGLDVLIGSLLKILEANAESLCRIFWSISF